MLTVTEARLVSHGREPPIAENALLRWAALAKAAQWRNLIDVRKTFSHADPVGICIVFNIKGNDFRLITGVDYGLQVVTLKHFLTHAKYDRGGWKKDCQKPALESQQVRKASRGHPASPHRKRRRT